MDMFWIVFVLSWGGILALGLGNILQDWLREREEYREQKKNQDYLDRIQKKSSRPRHD